MAHETDRVSKEYFDQLDRFSDLVNYALYNGREVTKPSDFKELDPVRSEVFGPDNSYEVLIDNLKEMFEKEYLDKFGNLIDDVSYVLVDINEDSVIPKGLPKYWFGIIIKPI